jgi:hypothetical protein
MWSDAARQAAIEARKKASGHNAGGGNRKVANHIADQHKSVLGGVVKGALIGSIVPGVGTVAGALVGGASRIAHNRAIDSKGK